MIRFWKILTVLAFAIALSTSTFAQTLTPQGRLTLTSNLPVLSSDVTNAAIVYYTPYNGNEITYNTGSGYASAAFTQYTLTLNPTYHLAGHIYDVYFVPGTSPFICAGPVWSSLTMRGSSAALKNLGPIYANLNAVPASTCWNGSNWISFDGYVGTYLGSIYMTGNGETSMQFKPTPASGGTNNVLGVYNAYNRVRTIARNIDSTNPPWTYSTGSWEPLENNNNNCIAWVDGLQQSSVDAQAAINIYTSSASVTGYLGVSFDTVNPTEPGGFIGLTTQQSTANPYGVPIFAFDHLQPSFGFHYAAAVQYATGSSVTYLPSSGGTEELKVELEM